MARSQRERLFAATVACVASKGYEETSVADLLERSGVSRSAFYEHFRDKEDCLIATFEAIVQIAMEAVDGEVTGKGSPEARSQRALDALLRFIDEQPGATRLCLEDIYMAGEPGRLAGETAKKRLANVVGGLIAEVTGEELPESLVYGLVGGAQSVVRACLRKGEDDSLATCVKDLWSWTLSYEVPLTPLRLSGKRARPPREHPPPLVAYSVAERIIRALGASTAERGYPAVTIAEIAGRASVSQATFYSLFPDKDAALVAALDSAASQMLGVVLPAYRRSSDWPRGVRAAIGAFCAFYASEPTLARLVASEPCLKGQAAREQNDRTDGALRALLEPGFEREPKGKEIVADAAWGAVWALLFARTVNEGPEALPELAPLASYIVLAPFLGSEAAVKVANGDGRS